MEEHRIKSRSRIHSDLSFIEFIDPSCWQVITLMVENGVLDIGTEVVRIQRYLKWIREVDGVDIGWIDSCGEDGEVILADEDSGEFLLASEGFVRVEVEGIRKEDHVFSLAIEAFVHIMQNKASLVDLSEGYAFLISDVKL